MLIAVGLAAGVFGIVLLMSHVTSHGSDCGTVLSPREPPTTDPNYALSACGGSRFVQTLSAVGCGVLAVACIVIGLVLLRRDRDVRSTQPSEPSDP